jgi:inhibitor of KinA
MQITPLGDSALIVRVCESSAEPDERSLRAVLDALHKIKSAAIPGILELAPAYTTIGIFFDPLRVEAAAPKSIFDSLAGQVRKAVSQAKKSAAKTASRVVEIPVCYDPEFALDLDEVAQITGLSRKEVVDLHRSATYRVNCVGFTPGFPFLSGLSPKLVVPRRSTPRKEIPIGSVAIAGKQTGVYPVKSPGGWNILGRSPVHFFDPTKNPPALLRAGDRVRFRSITRSEFEQLER